MDRILIKDLPTKAPAQFDKDKCEDYLKNLADDIGDMARILQAESDRNILIVLQGMDTSGKDGITRKVFSDTSPAIVSTYSFKKPTDEEFAHDFLWRVHKQAPSKGSIKVFIRSHYEDILIQRVHGWIDEERVKMRMDAINAFERLLQFDNNTTVLKFFLNISYDRQLEKLQERIDDPEKNWKHNDGDWKEREHWDGYMRAYEDILNWSEIPWIPVPVDDRWYRNYFVAKEVQAVLKKMNLEYPVLKTHG